MMNFISNTKLIFIYYLFITVNLLYACDQSSNDSQSQSNLSQNTGDVDSSTSTKMDVDEELSDRFDFDTCSFDQDDPYEPRSRFIEGPWQGECHNTEVKRPVYELTKEVAQQYQSVDGWTAIANVYHKDGFWIAFIPEQEVHRVFFQLEYFPAIVPAGHTQLRVQYNTPIVLYGQSTHLKGQVDHTYDLTLSIEAVTRIGDTYDLFKGAMNHFAIAYRITTMQARYHSMITKQNHHVEQWILDLEDEEKQALVNTYIIMSSDMSLQHAYHTLFRNCTTEIIEILDMVVHYTWGEQIKRFLVKVTEIYPNIVRAALVSRGLMPLDGSNDWFALEEDKEFIEQEL